MIVEGLFNIFFFLAKGLLTLLPNVTWNVDENSFKGFLDIIKFVCYLLPMKTVTNVISMIILLMVFRIVVSVIKTIWALIPIL